MKNIAICFGLSSQGINTYTIDDPITQEMQELAIVASYIQYARSHQNPWRRDAHTPILKEAITIPHGIYASQASIGLPIMSLIMHPFVRPAGERQ